MIFVSFTFFWMQFTCLSVLGLVLRRNRSMIFVCFTFFWMQFTCLSVLGLVLSRNRSMIFVSFTFFLDGVYMLVSVRVFAFFIYLIDRFLFIVGTSFVDVRFVDITITEPSIVSRSLFWKPRLFFYISHVCHSSTLNASESETPFRSNQIIANIFTTLYSVNFVSSSRNFLLPRFNLNTVSFTFL